jgi:hypothetical protein
MLASLICEVTVRARRREAVSFMEMPEFAADLHQELAAAKAELARLREAGDEEGALAYESRLASLRRIGAENGIELAPDADCDRASDSGAG